MVSLLKHACNHPGCPAIIPGDEVYCPAHKRESERRRGSASQRGYTSRWRRYSQQYLQENPLCVKCLPRPVPSYVTDHIKAVSGPDDPLFWESSNHQALCETCHNVKRATEDRGR